MAKDYYIILGISRGADQKKIQDAYRKIVKKYHPDVAGKESEERFKAISEAYDVLGNPQKKVSS